MYALIFIVGFFGFIGMAGLSFLHTGSHSHSGTHSHSGAHAHGGGAHVDADGGAIAHGHLHSNAHGIRLHAPKVKAGRFKPWWALSPFDIFAYCMGAGAAGELMRQANYDSAPTIAAAIAGALVFDFLIAKPVLNLLLKFESRQSEGLEGQVAKAAEAITRFDEHGQGLVKLALDGQFIQCLATLDEAEQERGIRVAKGDSLLVVDVDAARNTCRVTREFAS